MILLTSAYLKVYPEETKNIVSRGKTFSELKPFDELMEKFVSDNKIFPISLNLETLDLDTFFWQDTTFQREGHPETEK